MVGEVESIVEGQKMKVGAKKKKQMHKRYMASGTHCPICHIFKSVVVVDGAAA